MLRAEGLEVVVLPESPYPVVGDMGVGPHTVVISGSVEPFPDLESHDDDVSSAWDLFIDIETVHWRPTPLQASSVISWGEIWSGDSDEVNQSRWSVLNRHTGHVDQVLGGRVVRTLRLHTRVAVQGEYNSFVRFAFQLVANGTLVDSDHTARSQGTQTREIIPPSQRPTLPPYTRRTAFASEATEPARGSVEGAAAEKP